MDTILRPDERAGLALRELYHRRGYQPYRMSKFEPYDLYVRNKSFLVSENILTFTDTDGRLMALKPDVTLSIVKNAQAPAGALEKVYYSENVYRTSPASVGYREIMQSMYAVAKEAEQCVVYVRRAKEGEAPAGTGAHTGATGLLAADNGQELLVLSDNSVCEGAEQWSVIFPDHTRHSAKLVKQDGNRGLAVFGIDRASISDSTWNVIRVAELGNSNISVRGDLVIALGQMFGYENGVGYGIISAKEWDHDYADGQCGVIATDIAASADASGVLFNQKGQAIGLVKSGILGEGASASANALAVSDMKQVMGLLLNGEAVPYTGIFGTAVTDELSEEKKIPKGLYVTNVQADSPAMKAGIQNGDVILEVGDASVTGIISYEKAVLEHKAGEIVKVKGQRLGSGGYVDVDFSVTMGSRE